MIQSTIYMSLYRSISNLIYVCIYLYNYLIYLIHQPQPPPAQLEAVSTCPIDSEINLKVALRNENPSLVKNLYFH